MYDALLAEVVRAEVGRHTAFHVYDTRLGSPMGLVLRHALADCGTDVVVVWVDGGLPRMTSLPDWRPPIVIFSSRQVEIAAAYRNLLVSTPVNGRLLTELSERVTLRILAELTLHEGDPSLAAYFEARSLAGQDFFIPTNNTLMDLELATKDEAYASVWFFGLLHELGHVTVSGGAGPTAAVPRDEIRRKIDAGIAASPAFAGPPDAPWLTGRRDDDPHDPLALDHLAVEIACDRFAVDRLHASATELMARGPRPLDYLLFAREVVALLNVLSITEICARTARMASPHPPDRAHQEAALLTPVAIHVRTTFLLEHLARTFRSLVPPGEPPAQAPLDRWTALLADQAAPDPERLEASERGLARAQRQAFFPWEREVGLLHRLVNELSPLARVDLRDFVKLADEAGVRHADIEQLRQIAARGAAS